MLQLRNCLKLNATSLAGILGEAGDLSDYSQPLQRRGEEAKENEIYYEIMR